MLLSGVTMAAEEDATTTTTRRLRVRPPKLTKVLLEIDEEDMSNRKPEVTLESLYLQKNCKDPIHTQLETIFEDPRPSKVQQGQASQDEALLMANRKLKRYLVFPSHYQPPRNKLKQRKQCAQRFQRIAKVRLPTGNVISDDELLAALLCLEEETATPGQYQEQERGLLDPPGTSAPNLVEGMISVHNSLNGGFESPLSLPNQTHKEVASAQSLSSEEKGQGPRCDMIPKINGVSPSTSLTSSSTHQSSPPKMSAREKRLKRRSGLVLPQSSSSPSSFPGDAEAATNSNSPESPRPRVVGRPRGKRQSVSPQMIEHPTSSKDAQLKLGSKRSPEAAPATTIKKHYMLKTPQETTKDPAPTSKRGRGRGKDKKPRSSRLKPSLTLTNNSPSDSVVPASKIPQLLSTLPSPPKGQSRTLFNSPVACVVPAEGGDRIDGERGVEGRGGSPTPSPSARLAAPSLHVSPAQLSPLSKPKKVRRRSARLSIGSEVIDGLRGMQNGHSDVPLGTVWAAFSPLEKTTARRAVDNSSPPSTDTAKKKGRRRSNLFSHLEMMDSLRETAITTTTESTLTVPDLSARPVSASPPSLHPPTKQDSLTPLHHSTTPGTPITEPTPNVGTPHSCPQPLSAGMQQGVSAKQMKLTTTSSADNAVPPGHPQAVTEEAEEVGSLVREEQGDVVRSVTPRSGSDDSNSPYSPFTVANTGTYNILEACPDLSSPSLSPSPRPMASSAPASFLASSQTPPALAFTPSKTLTALTLIPAQTPAAPTLTPSPTLPAPSLTPSTTLPVPTLTPAQTPDPSLTPAQTPPDPSLTPAQTPDPSLTPVQTPASTLTPAPTPPIPSPTLAPTLPAPSLTLAQTPSAPVITSSQAMPSSAITPSQAIPAPTLTPSQALPALALTPSQTLPSLVITSSQTLPAPAITPSQILPAPALTPSQTLPSLVITSSQTLPAPAITPSQILPSLVITSSQTLPSLAITPSQAIPASVITPSQALPPPALTPLQAIPTSAITPSQAIPAPTFTPAQVIFAQALTPSQGPLAPALTLSQALLAPALTPSQAPHGPALTSSQAHLTQGTSSESDSDSPILQGILANHTLVQEGQVCYPLALFP
ncbi:mucin-2-like [Eriocheir sinensis]|uniref:mucin-2-like n=1 Tax=Eriocheir sinensis TaxID=95602 RepID=UPI0021C66B25|nr:mucin-2-like [Eriocheir sinensis]